MVSWNPFASTSSSASSSSTTAPPSPPVRPTRTFDELVKEEIPIQRASVAMEGGMPGCMTLFDNFLLCYSLASQTKHVYRYGTPRECSRKLEDFKFCMSVKSLTDERRNEVWIKRRAEWWAQRRLEKSSEDVWEARKGVYEDSTPSTLS